MGERWLVEYKLEGVDHIPVTMEYDTRKKAITEMERITKYHDLVYFRFERL